MLVSEINRCIVDNFRNVAKANGWSISKSSIKIGVSQPFLSGVYAGREKVSKRVIKEMSYILISHKLRKHGIL